MSQKNILNKAMLNFFLLKSKNNQKISKNIAPVKFYC